MSDLGILLPIRIETRFKNNDLWLRVIPDEPWFVRGDPRIAPDELEALRRYTQTANESADRQAAGWQALASELGAPRAVTLIRTFVKTGATGVLSVRSPAPDEQRGPDPVLPRIEGFPEQLHVWIRDAGGTRSPLTLNVRRDRLLVDFANPDIADDKRWWEDWGEAVEAGLAGIIPAGDFTLPIETLFVTGIGDGDPGDLFRAHVSEGRVGLLEPGLATNSVEGQPAAPLAQDPASWWQLLQTPPGGADRDVSAALTGDPKRLGNMPGGEDWHRQKSSALIGALWPALWGFAAGRMFELQSGPETVSWAAQCLFPEGAYPGVRIGSLPYGLLTTTAWSQWQPADGAPGFETPMIDALLKLRKRHADGARRRGTAVGKSTEELLDLIGDTPSSSQFRYRRAWPLELWWTAMIAAGVDRRWRRLKEDWSSRYSLLDDLKVRPVRRYGAMGRSRLIGIPLVVPNNVPPEELPAVLDALAQAALDQPAAFANTAKLEAEVLGGRGASLMIRLAIRSLQLLIGALGLAPEERRRPLLEPISRKKTRRGTLEQKIASATPADAQGTSAGATQLQDTAKALRFLATLPANELERRLAATVDCATHRIDPWLVASAQGRLDRLQAAGAARPRLGAYGWVDGPAPGTPGPTEAGLLHAPSPAGAMTAAILRDRAITEGGGRWDLNITSRSARGASRLAEEVRLGSDLSEVLGREIERIVGSGPAIEQLRRNFPVRSEHEGRRVCDGQRILDEAGFPVALDPGQSAAVEDLRAGLEAYADLSVASAVQQLTEGRAEAAGATLSGAAGLSRPPELSLLNTPREGRAVGTSALIALKFVPQTALPAGDAARALVSPLQLVDASVAAFIEAETGKAQAWDFELTFPMPEGSRTRSLDLNDLDLAPADTLALSRTQLEQLAIEKAASLEGLDPGIATALARVGGTALDRYEQAAGLARLIGRTPADSRSLSDAAATDAERPASADPALVQRLSDIREIASALERVLAAEAAKFVNGDLGTADADEVAKLIIACRRWGIAPDPLRSGAAQGPDAPMHEGQRMAKTATLSLAALQQRLAAAPNELAAASLSVADLAEKIAALITPTGQFALTAEVRADQLPPNLEKHDHLDSDWLTVVAAVRPNLARLEAHQLGARKPFKPWTNRGDDPWQTSPTDPRRLVAIYAAPQLSLASTGASSPSVAVAAMDRFSEVVPAEEMHTGAAFGFDAPGARAQQAILLAVPPDVTKDLNPETLFAILEETRELAHARMARPIDLDDELRALEPTALVPNSGAMAIPLDLQP